MRPPERRDVCQKVGGAIQAIAAASGHSVPEMFCVPINDDGSKKVQPGHPEVLPLSCPITDFALAANAQGVLEGVMRLSLVQADLSATLHVGIKQPVDDE